MSLSGSGKGKSPSSQARGDQSRRLTTAKGQTRRFACRGIPLLPLIARATWHSARHSGRRGAPGDQQQEVGEHLVATRDLGDPEGDVAAMADNFRADLDRLAISQEPGIGGDRDTILFIRYLLNFPLCIAALPLLIAEWPRIPASPLAEPLILGVWRLRKLRAPQRRQFDPNGMYRTRPTSHVPRIIALYRRDALWSGSHRVFSAPQFS